MGTKFANVHIKTNEMNYIIDFFKNYKSVNDSYMNRYYIGSFNESWVTVLGEDFNWESICAEAENISKYTEHPVLSIGYFDDDVLEITLYKNGIELTRCSVGPGIEEYGIKKRFLDTDLFIKTLNLEVHISNLNPILSEEDIEEVINKLEEVLQIPLWIKFDWIEEEEDEIKSKFEYVVSVHK